MKIDFLEGNSALLILRGKQIHFFGAKMAPCLWKADPSFRNSVTGSGSRAKCSNILQDIMIHK